MFFRLKGAEFERLTGSGRQAAMRELVEGGRAGFREVARRRPQRPVMRLDLIGGDAGPE